MSDTPTSPFVARYSDGETAASRDVHVRLTERGIVIERPDANGPLVWPYRALAIAEPLSAHSIDALISYADQPGAALFVPDKTFARSLAGRAPHLTAHAQRLRAATPWFWAAGITGLIVAGAWLADLSPAKAVARMLPDSAREMLGDQVLTSMTRNRATCAAPAGLAALDELTARLSTATGTGQRFKVVVVDWDILNAFATPGEHIVLTRALIEKAKSSDEVAGVLAHEMGHGIERHPETSIVRGIGLAAATELILGGAGGGLANIGLLLTQLSYSRDAEREADAHALKILKSSEVSPRGLLDFFDRVAQLEKEEGDGGAGVFRSHPQTEERRGAVAAAEPYAAVPALDAKAWTALKSICTVLTSVSPQPDPPVELPVDPAPHSTRPGETDS